jgi:hypothetical protein
MTVNLLWIKCDPDFLKCTYFFIKLRNTHAGVCTYRPIYIYIYIYSYTYPYLCIAGRDSVASMCISTVYGLDGPAIESQWKRDFPHSSRLTLGPTRPPIQLILGLSQEKGGLGELPPPTHI